MSQWRTSFKENQRSHNRQKQKMTLKPAEISGLSKVTSFIVTTINLEVNSMRRKKEHSLIHWNTLTSPELRIRIWMWSKSDASMIIGISMGQEICLVHGQVSLSLLYWKKNLQTDMCGPGGDWRENSLHPGQIIYGQSSGSQWESTPSWKRSRSGHMKSSILKTHENCEGSLSSTRRTRNSKKPSWTRVRSWKHQSLLLCPVKLWKIVGVVHPTKLRQNLRAFWKLVNLQDCVWENLYRIIMKTILQEKETIHCSITFWFTNLFLCTKPWKCLQQRQQWTRNGKIGENFGVELDKSQK